MKTSVNLVRKIGEYDVLQRTSDGYYNATALLKSWNIKSGSKKEVSKFLALESTKSLISEISNRENLNTQNVAYLKRGKHNGGTWVHPLLFIEFAMWVNVGFKYDALKFLQDQLVEYRIKIGDKHKETMKSLSILNPTKNDYELINKGINCIVFGKSFTGIRNSSTIEQLNELYKIQSDIDLLISRGYINSVSEVVAHLRKEFKIKNNIPF